MKKVMLLFILSLLVVSATNADEWGGDDKNLHLIAGGMVGLVGYATHDIIKPKDRERDKFITGWVLGSSVGLCKELYDQHKYSGFSYKDLAVTSAGAAVGSMIGTGIVWIDDSVFLTRTWRW